MLQLVEPPQNFTMKMQNEIGSPVAGTIKSINVNKGDNVKPGVVMAVISN